MTTSKSKNFWNNRYRDSLYVYGTQPNDFFKEFIDSHVPGKLLLPAEGEGRNAVYASSKGWEVDAFDFSSEARDKALKLASKNEVEINYFNAELDEVDLAERRYDLIALIYVHMESAIRRQVHRHLIQHLASGGFLLLEAFSKNQMEHDSGGPKDPDKLYDLAELQKDFESLDLELGRQLKIQLDEGAHHTGTADIVRMRARKG